MKQLFPVQVTHVATLNAALSNHGAALDGSITGAGKTICGAQIACQRQQPTFVVCPPSVIPTWKTELSERGVEPVGIYSYDKIRRGKTEFGVWAGRKQWQWKLPKDVLIIFDEVHKCKAFDTLNSKLLIGSKPYNTLMLSGSAAENPAEMRALGYKLGLHHLSNFWTWALDNGCVKNFWGGLDFQGGHTALDRIHKLIYPARGSRLTMANVAQYFTESRIITEPLDFGNKVAKIYKEMEKEIGELMQLAASDSKHPAAEALVRTLRARQEVELLKIPAMIELAEDLLSDGRSVVFFLNFKASIDALHARFEGSEIIDGRNKGDQREEIIKRFQADETRILICNIQAGGVGISLHDVRGQYPRASIISPSWSAYDVLQALGRINRAGAQSDTIQYVFFAEGTIEVVVEKTVREKLGNIQVLNDGMEVVVPDAPIFTL